MYSCALCGKSYKFPGGLNNHKTRCGAGGGGAAAVGGGGGGGAAVSGGGGGVAGAAGGGDNDDDDDITKSPFFTIPLTSFKPTKNFTKEDLEELERRKQSRLKLILKSRQEEKNKEMAAASAAAASAEAATAAAVKAATAAAKAKTNDTNVKVGGGSVVTNNSTNVGNEEHNASFNINYVKRSEETQEVVRSIVAAAHKFCKGRIIVTHDEPAPGGGPLTGISTSVNADGITVYNHPTRTITIIETPPEEVSPEEEHDITLEKMTYLIISLIQNNNKLTKENQMLRSIVDRIDPECFE
jgi:hypothetical protein